MNICKGCNKEILTANTKYCNFACRKLMKPVNCSNCNKEIYRYILRVVAKNYYCSNKCKWEMIKKDKTKCSGYGHFKRKEYVCLNCNKKNYIHQKGSRIYCNMKCKLEYFIKHPEKSSNYKGGKFINCLYCGKEKWAYFWELKHGRRKYCSTKCYMNDPNSPNRKFGIDNAMSNPKHREKIRVSIIKHILKYDIDKFRTGKNEKKILDYLENKFNIKIERHYMIGGYVVDGFIKDKNIVIEIDEKHHKHNYFKEKDIIRQKYLENEYNCSFIRIRDYINEDLEKCPSLS